MKKLIICIFVLFIFGCTNTKPDFTMTAQELYTLFDDNEIEASITYDDKLIQVEGYVSNLSGDKDEVILSMYPGINIYINNKIEDTVDIASGAYIVVIGRLAGDVIGRNTLVDSTVLEYNNLPDAKCSMTIEEFINDLEENEELAREKHLYSFVEITGKAYQGWFIGDNILISVLDNGFGGNINVYFTDDSIGETISNGSDITIVGFFASYNSMGTFGTFKYCRLVED